MKNPIIGLLTLELYLPGVTSLKEKRGIIKSMLQRLHNTFNVAAAEIDYLDKWQAAGVAVTCVSNESAHAYKVLRNVVDFVETHYPEALISHEAIDMR